MEREKDVTQTGKPSKWLLFIEIYSLLVLACTRFISLQNEEETETKQNKTEKNQKIKRMPVMHIAYNLIGTPRSHRTLGRFMVGYYLAMCMCDF